MSGASNSCLSIFATCRSANKSLQSRLFAAQQQMAQLQMSRERVEAELQGQLQGARRVAQAAQRRHQEDLQDFKDAMNLLLEEKEALQKQVSERAVALQSCSEGSVAFLLFHGRAAAAGLSPGAVSCSGGSMAAALKDTQCSAECQLLLWPAGLVLCAVGQQAAAWIPAGFLLLALLWQVLFQVPLVVGHLETDTSCPYPL